MSRALRSDRAVLLRLSRFRRRGGPRARGLSVSAARITACCISSTASRPDHRRTSRHPAHHQAEPRPRAAANSSRGLHRATDRRRRSQAPPARHPRSGEAWRASSRARKAPASRRRWPRRGADTRMAVTRFLAGMVGEGDRAHVSSSWLAGDQQIAFMSLAESAEGSAHDDGLFGRSAPRRASQNRLTHRLMCSSSMTTRAFARFCRATLRARVIASPPPPRRKRRAPSSPRSPSTPSSST